MADDDQIRIHGLEIASRVDQGFPLGGTAGRGRDIESVGAHPLGGDFEGKSGSGAGFEEQIDDGSSPQGRNLLDGSQGNLLEGFGGLQNQADVFGREILQTDNMLMFEIMTGVHSPRAAEKSVLREIQTGGILPISTQDLYSSK